MPPPDAPRLRAAPDPPAPVTEEEETLAEYLSVVVAARWLIAAVALLTLLPAIGYVLLAAPGYRSDILVQVEEKDQGVGILAGFADVVAGKVPAETEMEIIRSRSLVGAVADELALDVFARPRTFPVVGAAMLRRHTGDALRPQPLGLTRYAWGGERIRVARLEVPEDLLGKTMTLVAGEGGAFRLLGPEGEPLLDGRVGALATGNGVSLGIAELRARAGTEFVLGRLQRSEVVSALQKRLRISEKGKKTGIIEVELRGGDPKRIAATLDAVARTYLRQNVERKSAEAEKTLEFLETQLPELKMRLEAAESALEKYRATRGSVDVSLETQATLARSVELEKALSELDVQRAEMRQRFTPSHPAVAAVQDKVRQLQAERAAIEARLKKLPEAELRSARLIRDAKVTNELYVLLLNKAQELRVMKSGTIGNVRILDAAIVPVEPVTPKRGLTLALALALGVVLGVGVAFVRRALVRGVDDPEAIERETGIPVFAGVPRSDREARVGRGRGLRVLVAAEPGDVAAESLRSLRTSLQFTLLEARNGVVAVLGPAPMVGKTFCSVNLAAVLAESGKRVLLVDADLRKGRVHRFFGVGREGGLSDCIAGTVQPPDAIRRTAIPGLDVLAAGRRPPNAATLLGSDRFAELLSILSPRYDHVVVDTPPVLAVTDAALVARHAGVNLLVVRAGRNPMREIALAVKRLDQSGVRIQGIVLNDCRPGLGSGGLYYHYEYDRA